jgi:DNA (cytosine-5)-methyltransferase 1
MSETTIVDLCSGYGGLSAGLIRALGSGTVIAHAEKEPSALRILEARYPGVPNVGDVKTADWAPYRGATWVTAGYPCQGESAAGKGLGTEDERWIWPWIAKAVAEIAPEWVLFENVRGHVRKGLPIVLADLTALGYSGAWTVVEAAATGAPHHRARVFIVGRRTPGDFLEIKAPNRAEARGPLLKTPTAQLGVNGGPQHPDKRRAGGHGPTLEGEAVFLIPAPDAGRSGRAAAGKLFPSPPATDHRRHGGPGEMRRKSPSLGAIKELLQPGARKLLPTPRATTGGASPGRDLGAARDRGTNLGAAVEELLQPGARKLLPSPRATDGTNGGPNQRGSKGDLTMSSVVHAQDWADYEPAIRLWEAVTGIPAPAPLVPGARAPWVLNPELPEWMMGLDPGFVTGLGLSRSEKLRAIGNGVVPQQCEYAVNILLDHLLGRKGEVVMAEIGKTAVLAQIARDGTELSRKIVDAAMGPLAGANDIGEVDLAMPAALADALDVIAAHWRADAAARVEARKQGAKGQQQKAEYAAGLLVGISQHLRRFEPDAPDPDLVSCDDRSPVATVGGVVEKLSALSGALMIPAENRTTIREKLLATGAISPSLLDARLDEAFGPRRRAEIPEAAVMRFTPDGPGLTPEQARADDERRGLYLLRYDPDRKPGDVRHDGGAPVIVSAVPPFAPPVIVSAGDFRDAGGMDQDGSPPFPGDPGYCEPCDRGGHECQGCGSATEHDTPYACPDPTCPANDVPCDKVLDDGHAAYPCLLPLGHSGDHTLSATIAAEIAGMRFTLNPNPDPAWAGVVAQVADGYREAAANLVANAAGLGYAVAGAADAEEAVARAEVAGVAPPAIVGADPVRRLDIRRLSWGELAAPPARADELRPAHRSVSQLETYSGCGLKYRLQRYRETTDVPSWSLVGGLVVHEVIERMEASGWDKTNAEIWPAVFEDVVRSHELSSGIARDLWIAADSGKENGEWWLVEGERFSQNFRLWRKKMISDGWKILFVEHEINVPGDGTRPPLKGYLDLVMWHEATGVILLPDAKSGRNRPQSRSQLDIYGRALRELGVPGLDMSKVTKIEAAYLMLRKGELVDRHDVEAEGMAQAEIDYRLTVMDKSERAGVYLPNPSALCGSCGVRQGCPVGRPAAIGATS